MCRPAHSYSGRIFKSAQNHCLGQKHAVVWHRVHPGDDIMSGSKLGECHLPGKKMCKIVDISACSISVLGFFFFNLDYGSLTVNERLFKSLIVCSERQNLGNTHFC